MLHLLNVVHTSQRREILCALTAARKGVIWPPAPVCLIQRSTFPTLLAFAEKLKARRYIPATQDSSYKACYEEQEDEGRAASTPEPAYTPVLVNSVAEAGQTDATLKTQMEHAVQTILTDKLEKIKHLVCMEH